MDKEQAEKKQVDAGKKNLEVQMAAVNAQQRALPLRALDKRTALRDKHLMKSHFINTKRDGNNNPRVSNGDLHASGKFADKDRSDVNFEEKVFYLVEEKSGLMGEYTKSSLLSALSWFLPFHLCKKINPHARLSLHHMLVKFQTCFNSPAKLDAAEASLNDRKYNLHLVFADQVMMFHTKVLTFNDRCEFFGMAYKGRVYFCKSRVEHSSMIQF